MPNLETPQARWRRRNPDKEKAARARWRAAHRDYALLASGNRTSEYAAWMNAKQRVTNPRNTYWNDYGGRGIGMAAEWLNDFAAFLAHIGPKPDPSLTLDRIDNDRGYEPGNVRWATRSQQQRNRRPRRREAA